MTEIELTEAPREGEAQRGDFRIQIAPCNVTGERAKVISHMAGTIDLELDSGEQKSLDVWVSYSAEGLATLQRTLEASPFPVDLPTAEEIRKNVKYQWVAHYADGEVVAQFPDDLNLGHLDLPRVQRLVLEPRGENVDGLPHFCLDRQCGFQYLDLTGMWQPLCDKATRAPLPCPTVPFHLEYQRRVHVTFVAGPGVEECFPPSVRQELGWRVDCLHGDAQETWFMIAVEDSDGTWQVCRQEPVGSRHFGPRVIPGDVRFMEPYG